MIEIRQLELFAVLADELHFGRTAARLFIAQASVSQQLQKLEDEVGVRLVVRTSRRVELTPAGRVFLDETKRVIPLLDRAVSLARGASAGDHGSLRIGSNYPASRVLLLPLIERLRSHDPSISTALREMGTTEQERALRTGELDLGLLFGPIDDDEIASEPLIEIPIVAIVRPGHPLAGCDSIDLRSITQFSYLTGFLGGTTVIEDELLRVATATGIRLKRSSDLASVSQYLLKIETSDTIGFSSSVRGTQIRASGLSTVRFSAPEPALMVHAAWSRTVTQHWVNVARDELRWLAKTVTQVA